MRKFLQFRSIFLLFVCFFSELQAQTTILNQSLQNAQSFSMFSTANVTGVQNWYYTPAYGAVCGGYSAGQSQENEDWLISPLLNLSTMDDVQLTFDHTRGNAAVMNVGVAAGWYKVFASANYTGDPATTTWIELSGVNQTLDAAWQFVSSGSIVIPEAARSETSRIAFRYMSSATESATWEIKNVKVTGVPQGTGAGSDGVFKITNWNTEWLGCSAFGPDDEELQLNNVVTAMVMMDSDVYALQEVSNTISNPTIESIVTLLGSDVWGGAIVPTSTGDCTQRQGIIYKKSKVQFVSAYELSSGNAAEGNSYYYNWSSGRYPSVYNVNFIAGSTLLPVSLVNIHAKAEDGNPASYTRRLGGSEALKEILDGSDYNTKNLILIGDYNDYLVGTTSNFCGCSDSPYKNFMDDPASYTGVTTDIIDVNTDFGTHPLIENIIISDELTANYLNSAQDVEVLQAISDYGYTTSNHLPVTAVFDFSSLSTPNQSVKKWAIYPVPAKEVLNVTFSSEMNGAIIEIYDVTGRKMYSGALTGNTIDVSSFPTGLYLLKAANATAKFVKE